MVQNQGACENFAAGIVDIPRIKVLHATQRLGKKTIFQGSLLRWSLTMLEKERIVYNDKKIAVHANLASQRHIHALGVNYIYNFLSNAGFTIHEMNIDPDHHFQILAKANNKTMLIAVRTAYYPHIGVIDQATQEQLIEESEQVHAVPHFAGLALTPLETTDMSVDGSTAGQEYKILFSGISVVSNPGSFAANS